MDKLKLREQSEKLFKIHLEISGFYSEYAKSVGMTFSGLKVLAIILEVPECSQKTITQYTYLPKQTVNAIIKSLIKAEIVAPLKENGSDKRNKLIKLTKEGKKYAQDIVSRAKDIEYRALDSLGDERINKLIEIINMYKNNLKKEY